MKQFLVFAGDDYYPQGGWEDFRGMYDDFQSASERLDDLIDQADVDWGHVVDLEAGVIVLKVLPKPLRPVGDEFSELIRGIKPNTTPLTDNVSVPD